MQCAAHHAHGDVTRAPACLARQNPRVGETSQTEGPRLSQQPDNTIAVLDAGSSKVRALVAEIHEGALRYRGHGVVDSAGMRKGLIADLSPAASAWIARRSWPKIPRRPPLKNAWSRWADRTFAA